MNYRVIEKDGYFYIARPNGTLWTQRFTDSRSALNAFASIMRFRVKGANVNTKLRQARQIAGERE